MSDELKSYTFPSFTVNGSTIANIYSTNAVNGEILRVSIKNVTSPGSIWVGESGTNIELFRHTSIASGTANINWYPRQAATSEISGGAVLVGASGNIWNPVAVNSHIYFAGSGFTSGTGKTFGEVTILYR